MHTLPGPTEIFCLHPTASVHEAVNFGRKPQLFMFGGPVLKLGELWVYWPYGPASSSSGLVSDTRSGTKSSGQQIVASQRRDCDHWSVTYTAADAADAAGAVCFEPRLYLHTVIAHGISSGFLLYLHLTAHIWDVMLVWRKWNINENCLCATVLCNNNGAQWYEQFLGPSTVSGFDLAWFSSLSQALLCLRSSRCYINIIFLLCLLVRWTW